MSTRAGARILGPPVQTCPLPLTWAQHGSFSAPLRLGTVPGRQPRPAPLGGQRTWDHFQELMKSSKSSKGGPGSASLGPENAHQKATCPSLMPRRLMDGTAHWHRRRVILQGARELSSDSISCTCRRKIALPHWAWPRRRPPGTALCCFAYVGRLWSRVKVTLWGHCALKSCSRQCGSHTFQSWQTRLGGENPAPRSVSHVKGGRGSHAPASLSLYTRSHRRGLSRPPSHRSSAPHLHSVPHSTVCGLKPRSHGLCPPCHPSLPQP